MTDKPSVVFFGSGPVAARSLQLLSAHTDIEAVVTKPKPAHHKGSFPVLDVSQQLGLKTYTVSNKAELSTLMADKPFTSQVGVLIDFGIIVSQDVIDYFPHGIINSHFSLLPEWRGADPITFAILSGQAHTGVSLMLLVEAMDEGPVIACGVKDLTDTVTTPELTEDLILLSDALLKRELPRYLSGDTKAVSQDELSSLIPNHPSKASYSRKLTKADGVLDFNKPARVLEREIRAFIEWPKSSTKLGDIDVVITSAHVTDDTGTPGTHELRDKQLLIFCAQGALDVHTLKPAGKADMPIEAFLAGYKDRI